MRLLLVQGGAGCTRHKKNLKLNIGCLEQNPKFSWEQNPKVILWEVENELWTRHYDFRWKRLHFFVFRVLCSHDFEFPENGRERDL